MTRRPGCDQSLRRTHGDWSEHLLVPPLAVFSRWRQIQYWSLLNWYNLRFRCGCIAVPVNWFFDIISSWFFNLRTLYIVWSQVRRRVTRRLTSSKLCAMFLNIAIYLKTLRCGCGAVAFICSIYLKSVLYVEI